MNGKQCRLVALRFALAFAHLSAVALAHAEADRPELVLELRQCGAMLEDEVRRIVGVELRATVVQPAQDRGAVTRVVAACRGTEVDLWVADAATSKRIERTVALSEAAPSARARLLALATAELVAASWEELEQNPRPKVPAVPPPAPSASMAVRKAIAQRRTRTRVEVLGVARGFTSTTLLLFGPGARANVELAPPFVLSLEVTAEWGNATRAFGQVAAQSMSGAIGLGWDVDTTDWCRVMPNVALRAGFARLTGEPNAASVGRIQSGPWLGPEIGITTTLFPDATVHGTLALSGGVAPLGVQGEIAMDRNVSVFGPWAAATAGLGFVSR